MDETSSRIYIELVRKADNKQVYTSPPYFNEDETFNFGKIKERLNYYFERVNGAIQQQLDSPKLSEEQKSQLKLLDKHDYYVNCTEGMPLGVHVKKSYWKKEATEFLDHL